MRTLSLIAALLLASLTAAAQDLPKPLSIAIEPLGDRDQQVVVRVFFRFANPRAITEAGLFLEGSFTQDGQVPRNFRFAVPRKGDKVIWNKTFSHNSEVVRSSRWAVLPDQRNEMAIVRKFAEGETEIDVRLILESDDGRGPLVVAKATEKFTLTKTNHPYAADAENDEPDVAAQPSPVSIRPPRRIPSGLFRVDVDVLPPVKRVEFRIENKRALARSTPPYTAELDLGPAPKSVAVRAIGYDAAGHYVDADAFVVNDGDALAVKITRTATPDGLSHFKLSVRNPKGARLKIVALYAGDRKLREWDEPPYAVSVPDATLAGADSVRAVVIDESGNETTDVQVLKRDR
jgi:hypothetical protein